VNLLFFQDTIGVGGAEMWIADAAIKLRNRGHQISMGCPSGSWMERQAEKKGITCFDYLLDEEFEGSLRWLLSEHILEHNIDLICCSIPGTRTEVPLLHQAIQETGKGRILLRLGVSPGEGALREDRVGIGYDSVSGVVVVSEDIKRNLVQERPELDPSRIHVIYNGVDVEKFDPSLFSQIDAQSERARLGIPNNHLAVATIGRLDGIKNLPMFVRSASEVLRHYPDTTFVVVGEGGEKQNLIRLANDAGILDQFIFSGFVEDIPRLLSSVDILVHTSLSEGLPNAVLEAMSMGKPVVATDVGGVSELIENGENGQLIDSGDSEQLTDTLCELIRSPDRMNDIGKAARSHAKSNFDRISNMDHFESLILNLVEEPRSVIAPSPAIPMHDLPSQYFKRSCAFQSAQ
jgi:glycosyltransferase involved in cell wall biosynthesis